MVALALIEPDIALNVGACVRTAACFGTDLHVVEPCGFPFGPAAWRRAAMDYEDLAQVRRHVSWAAFEAWLGQENRRLILFTTKGAVDLWAADLHETDVFAFGSESRGASENVHRAADLRVRIPLRPGARSLNLAVSVGIAAAETARRFPRGEN